MSQQDVNIIDPFSRKKMTDPVKNKICGHVYDREMLALVLKNQERFTKYAFICHISY